MTTQIPISFSSIVSAVVIINIFCNTYVDGIYCYQCNSLNDPECATLRANDTHSYLYRPCEQQAYTTKEVFCRKIVQIIADRNNLVRIVRRCSWERHSRLPCYRISNLDHEEIVCQCFTDGCNSAPSHHWSSLLTSILITACTFLFM